MEKVTEIHWLVKQALSFITLLFAAKIYYDRRTKSVFTLLFAIACHISGAVTEVQIAFIVTVWYGYSDKNNVD